MSLPYDDAEIEAAIAHVADDVGRRREQPEFPAEAMTALVDQLERIEAARRAGDRETARVLSVAVIPALDAYRPTNASARSKAIVREIIEALAGSADDGSP